MVGHPKAVRRKNHGVREHDAGSSQCTAPYTGGLRACWGTLGVKGARGGGRVCGAGAAELDGATHAVDGSALVRGKGLCNRRGP